MWHRKRIRMKKDKMLIAVISELWVYGDLNIKMTFLYFTVYYNDEYYLYYQKIYYL